ncbi:MAG: glycosyltransferase family 4 protein, partial [Anaerocolumna sp.]
PAYEMEEEIRSLGARYYPIPGTRTGLNMMENIKELLCYIWSFYKLKPDLCFLYMTKPIMYGGLAAIINRVKHVHVFVTGLEVVFYSKGVKNTLIRSILRVFYKAIHKKCEKVFFMNQDDYNKMKSYHLVEEEKVVFVNGSGVNTEVFAKETMSEKDTVCMTARLVYSKGIREYVNAAKIIRKKHKDVEFLLVGGKDENPEAISESKLKEIIENGSVKYCGYAKDVRPFLKECTIFVLPSYHEGNGRSIVEAEAIGRPIITTNTPGCRDTVISGYNGFLVPARNSKALAQKIEVLLNHKELKNRMAENSYRLCLERFEVKKINKIILDNMKL